MSVNAKRSTVTTTATRVDPNVDPMVRSSVLVTNLSIVTVFLGGSGVTTVAGYPLDPGDSVAVDLTAREALYAIVGVGTAEVAALQSGGVP